jgi:hypothetical protein
MVRRAVVILGALAAGLTSARAQDCAGPIPGRCSLLDYDSAIFVGTLVENTGRFRVSEAFKGVKGSYVDVVEMYGRHFELGQQYLVFADLQRYDANSRFLKRSPCSPTLPLKYAAAVLEQLRAEKSGRRVAPVYGMLTRKLAEDGGIADEDYVQPLPNVLVRLQSKGKPFETRTDAYGAFAFNRLPPGAYQVSADLPPNFVLGDLLGYGDDPAPPLELPRRTCFDNDFYAYPTARIAGKVLGPDRRPLAFAGVSLYRASRYKQGARGLSNWRGAKGGKTFEFTHLPAGDYVLVFNPEDKEDPNQPFPVTFYPQATNLESSRPIHLSDGQQILDADIRVSNPLPTRKVTIRLDWDGRMPQDYYRAQVIAKASRGAEPFPIEDGQDTYTLNLLLGARYTIHVEALCKFGTTGKAETPEVPIDGGNVSLSDVTLKFDTGACTPK